MLVRIEDSKETVFKKFNGSAESLSLRLDGSTETMF